VRRGNALSVRFASEYPDPLPKFLAVDAIAQTSQRIHSISAIADACRFEKDTVTLGKKSISAFSLNRLSPLQAANHYGAVSPQIIRRTVPCSANDGCRKPQCGGLGMEDVLILLQRRKLVVLAAAKGVRWG
jgi:hypothetical protein